MKKAGKEMKERVMNHVEKSNSEEYETSCEENEPKHKKVSKVAQGKKSRAQGAKFELKVREDLTSKGFIVDKWTNNVDLKKDEIFAAKRKFNPFSKVMSIGTGFPDFIAIENLGNKIYRIIGIEVKTNGVLSKEEKDKCAWYLRKEIFSRIWVAKSWKDGRKTAIEYEDFQEKYGYRYGLTEE